MKSKPICKAPHGPMEHLRKTATRPASPVPAYVAAINQRPAPAPADRSWDSWFAGESVTADFLNNRDQPMERAGVHPWH